MVGNFKFKYVQNGNAKGFLSSKGTIDERGLQLGEFFLPHGCIADSTNRDARLVLQLNPAEPDFPRAIAQHTSDGWLVLEVYGAKAEQLERQIDRFSSAVEAKRYKAALEAEGKGHLFRTVACPCCQATVNLSEYPETSFTYCRFCETIFGKGLSKLKGIERFRECDECGYHDRVQGYGEFYFYFLLVLYGFSHKRRHMCDACGASLATKLLAINALFLLGVPNAIACGVRARAGKDPTMKTLAKANKLARKGRLAESDQLYSEVLRTFPDHPGVRYNQAVSYLRANQAQQGLEHLRSALEACPNYEPAQILVHRLTTPRGA